VVPRVPPRCAQGYFLVVNGKFVLVDTTPVRAGIFSLDCAYLAKGVHHAGARRDFLLVLSIKFLPSALSRCAQGFYRETIPAVFASSVIPVRAGIFCSYSASNFSRAHHAGARRDFSN